MNDPRSSSKDMGWTWYYKWMVREKMEKKNRKEEEGKKKKQEVLTHHEIQFIKVVLG